jgi:hypothetical protein
MKLLTSALILLFLAGGTLAQNAFADPPRPGAGAGGGQHGPAKPGKRKLPGKAKKKVLDKFDTDGDGKLSPAEREKAKAWRKAKKEKKGKPGKPGKKATRPV